MRSPIIAAFHMALLVSPSLAEFVGKIADPKADTESAPASRSYHFEQELLFDACRKIASDAAVPYVLVGDAEQQISCDLQAKPYEALNELSQKNSLQHRKEDGAWIIVALSREEKIIIPKGRATRGSQVYEKAAEILRAAPPRRYEIERTRLNHIVQLLSLDGKIDLIPLAEGDDIGLHFVSLSLEKSPFSTLEVLSAASGLTLERQGKKWALVRPKPEPLSSRKFVVDPSRLGEVLSRIKQILRQSDSAASQSFIKPTLKRSAKPVPDSDEVEVLASESDHLAIANLIHSIEAPAELPLALRDEAGFDITEKLKAEAGTQVHLGEIEESPKKIDTSDIK